MIETLFTFPIMMADGDAEDAKEERSKSMNIEPEAVELIVGEAECPYYDFAGVSDRWTPDEESKKNARLGKFDTCLVTFATCGQYLVPLPKRIFKKRLKDFINALPKEHGEAFKRDTEG